MIWFLPSRSDTRDCSAGAICVVICWFMGRVFACIYGVMFSREGFSFFYFILWFIL